VLCNSGTLLSRTPVVASFNIADLAPVFFKVIAVDETGNKSEPSSGVSATAELIDSAHISSLTVSKVTAGTITADWIVAAYIKTGSVGARTEMNPYGFTGYDRYNRNTFWVDAGSGNVWMKGQIKTGEDDEARIIMNPGQDNPRILFYPSPGFGDHVLMAVAAYTDPRGVTNTGLHMAALDSSDNPKGGEIQFGQTGVRMSHYNTSTFEWAYHWIDEQSRHTLRGTWNINNFDPYSAFVVGSTPTSVAGEGGLTYSYGMTFASAIRVVASMISVSSPAGYNRDWAAAQLSGLNTTGFTLLAIGDYSAPGPDYRIAFANFWGYRI
jgi:hypothetical protein